MVFEGSKERRFLKSRANFCRLKFQRVEYSRGRRFAIEKIYFSGRRDARFVFDNVSGGDRFRLFVASRAASGGPKVPSFSTRLRPYRRSSTRNLFIAYLKRMQIGGKRISVDFKKTPRRSPDVEGDEIIKNQERAYLRTRSRRRSARKSSNAGSARSRRGGRYVQAWNGRVKKYARISEGIG